MWQIKTRKFLRVETCDGDKIIISADYIIAVIQVALNNHTIIDTVKKSYTVKEPYFEVVKAILKED